MSQDFPRLIERRGDLWGLYKPSGVAVHATNDPSIPDLMTWAAAHLEGAEGLSPIHRLDRATSGVVLCSADPQLRGQMGHWFAEGGVKKVYLALVFGKIRRKGILKRPLKDQRRGKPVPAVTRYNLLETFKGCSLVKVRPETGRKHQIRKHLQGLGHSIVGDERYRPKRPRKVAGFPGRLWLHATRLELPDGTCWEAPLPDLLEEHLHLLRARRDEVPQEPSS